MKLHSTTTTTTTTTIVASSALLLLLLISIGCCLFNSAVQVDAQLSLFAEKLPSFVEFKKIYGKIYASSQEDARRERIFNKTLTKIDKHNRLFNDGRATYALYPCEYSDMDEQEVATFLKGIILPDDILDPDEYTKSLTIGSAGSNGTSSAAPRRSRRQAAASKEILPESVDYRTSGCLSLPKDQKFW